jgi:hypothetical protein
MPRTNEGKPPGWRPCDEYENDEKEDDSCWLLDPGKSPFHYEVLYHEIHHPMLFDRCKSKRRDQMVSAPSCWTRLLCLNTYPKTLKDFGVCFPFSPAVFAQMENSPKKDIIHICPFLHILRSQKIDYSDWTHMWMCGCAHPPLVSLKSIQQKWPVLGRQIRRHFQHGPDGEPLDHHAVLVGNPDDKKAPGHGEVHVVPAYHYLEPIVTLGGVKRKRGQVGFSFSSPKQTATRWRARTLHSLRYEQRDSTKHIVIGT